MYSLPHTGVGVLVYGTLGLGSFLIGFAMKAWNRRR
jgi:LPXTG-motif cell wall-anchored protein